MPTATPTQPSLPKEMKKSRPVALGRLLLDAENPRLALGASSDSPKELLRVLWTEMAVDEVAISIARNGYYESEPLLVVPAKPTPKSKKNGDTELEPDYVVIEGNRRLAAVMLLKDPGLRAELKATDLPSITPARSAELEQLPVLVFKDRRSLWTEVGFRHINGTKPWDSFSKAKYVASVFGKYSRSLDEIADRIGDRHSTVKRLYRGFVLYEQAVQRAGFSTQDTAHGRFFFSHLYTAADQKEFQDFLGIDADDSLKQNPVPKAKLKNLSELMLWLYGRKSTSTQPVVRTQNPDLNNLRIVLANPEALAVLRKTGRLSKAWETAIGDRERFSQSLAAAKMELQTVRGTVLSGYNGDEDEWRTIGEIADLATSLKEDMRVKFERRRAQKN